MIPHRPTFECCVVASSPANEEVPGREVAPGNFASASRKPSLDRQVCSAEAMIQLSVLAPLQTGYTSPPS